MRKSILLLSIMACTAGCATESKYQKTTAELTGCSADDVQISDVQTSGSNTWKAICRNDARIYRCSKAECIEIK